MPEQPKAAEPITTTIAQSQVDEEADWHNIVLWRAENLAPYLVKGKQVYVEGRLTTLSWEDQDGNRRYTTEVIAAKVILLGGSNGNGSESKPQPPEESEPNGNGNERPRSVSAPARRSGPSSGAAKSTATGRSGNTRRVSPDAAGAADDDCPF